MRRSVAVMGTVLAVLIPVSCLIISVWGEGLSGLVYSGEGFVYRTFQHIFGNVTEVAASTAVFLAVASLALCIRRKKRRKSLGKMKCTGIFARFLDMLHFAGFMKGL